jgi:hypothetical protein
MRKKTMLVALLAASATLLALPALVTGEEVHLQGIASFEGSGSASSLTTESEPTLTCESTEMIGTVEPGGTTGSMTLDITGCHGIFFGFTVKCHTFASPLDNTVIMSATFHLITSNQKPAVLTTVNPVTVTCIKGFNVIVSGSSIATISSPICSQESKALKLSFNATGFIQEDRLYTGVEHDLKFQTGEGPQRTAATSQTWTIASETLGTLICT